MREFKFFQKENEVRNRMFSAIIERLQTENEERTINDALRHEEYLHNLHNVEVRGESVVDWGQMAREIRDQARLREIINRPINIPEEFQHRGRRPR